MKIDQLEELIIQNNPHWQKGEIDKDLLQFKRDLYSTLLQNLTSNLLILTISGPRRIGKSFLLKQLITYLQTKKTIPATNLLYFQFGSQLNEKNIIYKLLGLFLEKYAQSKSPIYVFFDELQFIDYWQDQIKFFYDKAKPSLKFVITGSTSLFSRQKSKESLLGRILKLNLQALSFNEYLKFKKYLVSLNSRQSFLKTLPLFRSEFKKYLAVGQFPELVLNSKLEPKLYLNSLIDQLINFDIAYIHQPLDRTLMFNLFKTLSFELSNEVSIRRLASGLETDRRIISSYLKILQEIQLFSLSTNAYYRRMRAKLSASKKLYSLNTNLSLVANGFDASYLNDARVFGHYVENYAFMRLKAKEMKPLEYYSDNRQELDFVSKDTAWKVKSGKVKDLESYLKLAKKLKKRFVLITESEYEPKGQPPKIPIYLL